mgnify:CR=1 FL=1
MKEFSKYFDHTLLKPDASAAAIDRLCDEAAGYGFASVCVNGCHTARAYEKLKNTDVKVATVVGFPLGAMSTAVKSAETRQAVADGASEIDMVINIGAAKDGSWSYIRDEIATLADICHGHFPERPAILKVILETCLLSDDEITKLCSIAEKAGADFQKRAVLCIEKNGGENKKACRAGQKTALVPSLCTCLGPEIRQSSGNQADEKTGGQLF